MIQLKFIKCGNNYISECGKYQILNNKYRMNEFKRKDQWSLYYENKYCQSSSRLRDLKLICNKIG